MARIDNPLALDPIRFPGAVILAADNRTGRSVMKKWTKPKVVEISVGCEINCYACAEV